ncbi:hypothetical protein AltI4_09770 [Alteromonas sp. I4]|nr:hypothetical protein AltI4_09770 [Alteromonas sp. I4]
MTGGTAVKLPDMAYELMETGYHAMLNYQHRDWGKGFSTVTLQIEPKHLNLAGVLHGGVLSGLLDIVCAQSGIYFPDEQVIRRSVTLSLTTTFTGQCSEGGITACGKVRAQGRRIYSASGEVKDAQGNLLAFGEGTFRYRSQDPIPANK